MAYPTSRIPSEPCVSCPEPFLPGQWWIYHARLQATVHATCADSKGVFGEDISTHTVFMTQVPYDGEDPSL